MGHGSSLITLVLLSCAISAVKLTAADEGTDILQCYNAQPEGAASGSGASFSSFLREQPPRLWMHRLWRSSRPSTLQLTIITVATVSRLTALELQCSSWAGPLVAAIYLALPNSSNTDSPAAARTQLLADADDAALDPQHVQMLQEASNALQQLLDRSEARSPPSSGCQLQLLLLYERTLDPDVSALLPINALRNAALAAASTELVALVDVDLMLSQQLSTEVQDPDRYRVLRQQCRERQAWILPAFETPKLMGMDEGQALVEASVRGSKAGLAEQVAAGKLQPFASAFYPRGHACTDFKHWYSSSQPYAVQYSVNCEPWFIIDRLACPGYDARFRGYGWNKVQQVAFVNASGFSFWVHPSAFLIHRPHPRSEAQNMYTAASLKAVGPPALQPSRGSGPGSGSSSEGRSVSKLFHRKVAAMRHTALRDMLRGVYRVVLDEGSKACKARLRWWQAASMANEGA